jgi:hypothetical protein
MYSPFRHTRQPKKAASAKAKGVMQDLDGMVRTRLPMCQWKAWKQPKTRVKELVKLGFSGEWSYKFGNSSKKLLSGGEKQNTAIFADAGRI